MGGGPCPGGAGRKADDPPVGSPMRLPLALLALAVAPGCLTPPALLPALHVDGELAIELYPPGTERVSVEVADEVVLRGLFVPSDDGAPVVLHLLESSGSVASLKYHYAPLLGQLTDLGHASLAVDYTGVGASDGPARRATSPATQDFFL